MEISAYIWVFVVSSIAGIGLIIAANIWCFKILSEVNSRLSESDQIDCWQIRRRLYEVFRLHAKMCPESPKRTQFWTLVVIGAMSFGGILMSVALNAR